MKYVLISYLILAIVMLYMANKMLSVKDHLEKKVLGSYYSQMEEVNKATGMEVYNLDSKTSYSDALQQLDEIK